MQQVEDTNFVRTTRSCGSKLSDENEKSRLPFGEMSFQGPSAIPTRALLCLGQGVSVKSASSRERLRALGRNNTVIQKTAR